VIPQPPGSAPNRYRYRLRICKQGDVRWIGHRDLVRTIERMVRRAELTLRMSEGFHPKPKLMFPTALALGVEGRAEVLELELLQPADPRDVQRRLNAQAPPGLSVVQIQVVPPGAAKARVRAMVYQFPVPRECQRHLAEAVQQLLASPDLLVERDGRPPVNMRADLESLECHDDHVQFRIAAGQQATLRPRDVLQALGLAELEQQGSVLTRTEVELTS
jgi:radical SAM-linked protein